MKGQQLRSRPLLPALPLDEPATNLVPLRLATELIWRRIYGQRTSAAAKDIRLNRIARTLLTTGAVYQYNPQYNARADATARRLSGIELRDAVVRNGGEEIRFLDGRPPKRLLAVLREDVQAAIGAEGP